MNCCRFLFINFLLFPIYMFAHIPGTYQVSGFDPATNQNYTGVLVITKEDSIYTANWTFTNTTDTGTGVRNHDSLAFVFNENNSSSFGVQLYEIEDDTLRGPWVRFGATEKGFEKATKLFEASPQP